MNYMNKQTLVLMIQIELSVLRPKIMKTLNDFSFINLQTKAEVCKI